MTEATKTVRCAKCGREIDPAKAIQLSVPKFDIPAKRTTFVDERWCKDCWRKDLNNDSGSYFDNFVDR